MNRINNTKGVTLPLALLFFIICAVIGSVILATATVASNRVGGLVSQQQPYYTTSSAATMMKNILEHTSCELVYIEDAEGNLEKQSATTSYQDRDSLLPNKFLTTIEEIYQTINTVSAKHRFLIPAQSLTLTIDTTNSDLTIENDAKLLISHDDNTAYDIKVLLKKEIDEQLYQCQLVAPAAIYEVREIIWYDKNNQIIENPLEYDLSECSKKEKITTTISWPEATIKAAEVKKDEK